MAQISYAVENFLTENEIGAVLSHYDTIPYSKEYSSPNNRRKMMNYDDPNSNFFKELFDPKIKLLYPTGKVSACTFTDWHHPVEIHTDGWQPHEDNTRKLGYAILVPLLITPSDVVTSTIIFQQRYIGPTVTLKHFTQSDPWNISEYINSNDPRIENKSQKPLDIGFYEKHLKHLQDPQIIRNLSIDGVYDWSIASAIVWDRSDFHTSSSFVNKLKNKLHAIFFVTLDA